MNAKKIAEIIRQAALATLRQVPGINSAELEHIARAIANNAAQALAFEAEGLGMDAA
jgi:Holliday junction resolvasome RuvABC DNA-binding subunit